MFRRMEVLDHKQADFKGISQPQIRVVPYPNEDEIIYLSVMWEVDGDTYGQPQALTPEQAVALGEYLIKWGKLPHTTISTENEVIKI